MSNLEKSQSRVGLAFLNHWFVYFLWKVPDLPLSFCLEQLGISTEYPLKNYNVCHTRSGKIHRCWDFAPLMSLRLCEVCPLRIPNRQPPWLLVLGNSSVYSAWWSNMQGFVKVTTTACVRHTWGQKRWNLLCTFIPLCPHSPRRRRRRRAGWAALQRLHCLAAQPALLGRPCSPSTQLGVEAAEQTFPVCLKDSKPWEKKYNLIIQGDFPEHIVTPGYL